MFTAGSPTPGGACGDRGGWQFRGHVWKLDGSGRRLPGRGPETRAGNGCSLLRWRVTARCRGGVWPPSRPAPEVGVLSWGPGLSAWTWPMSRCSAGPDAPAVALCRLRGPEMPPLVAAWCCSGVLRWPPVARRPHLWATGPASAWLPAPSALSCSQLTLRLSSPGGAERPELARCPPLLGSRHCDSPAWGWGPGRLWAWGDWPWASPRLSELRSPDLRPPLQLCPRLCSTLS